MITTYCHGVKAEIGNLLWYYTPYTDEYFATGYSEFVIQMHNRNLAVHVYQLKDDQVQYLNSIEDETAMVIIKGVDGVHSDYTLSMYTSLSLLGSRSDWPDASDNLDTDVTVEEVNESPF